MLAIDELLRQATDSPVDTIVHVGAGSGAVLDRYVRLAPSKVVLVEGDPEAAAALQRAARPFRWAQVVAQASTREDGEVVWNRYNLPMLNGPAAADALTSRYPRLRREGVASVPGIALSSLLRSVLENDDGDASTVLLLDVPGQEGALLDSIRDQLSALAAVIVRRCALPLPEVVDWSTVQEKMREHSFELVGHEIEGEPLWPVAVFRFDRRGHVAAMLRAEVETQKARLARLEADLIESRAAADRAAVARADEIKALAVATAAAEKLAAEREQLVQQVTEERDRQATEIAALSARLTQAEARAAAVCDVESLRTHVDRVVKRESLNVIKQLEAFDSVRSALGSDVILPEFHGWPISADFAAHLLTLLRSTRFDLVVEFGSGTSTFIVAAALAQREKDGDEQHKVSQIAFEHSPEHLEITRGRIRDLGLKAEQIVHAAPLIPYKHSSGEVAPYYDCAPLLEAVRNEGTDEGSSAILVIVDGPPAATGPLARYPALDCILRTFPKSSLCILLDDYSRADEKEVVERWKADLERAGRRFCVKAMDFEKGACQLEVAA